MFTVERCSDTALFSEWSNQVTNFGKALAMTIFFFLNCLKFDGNSINGTKNSENVFCF